MSKIIRPSLLLLLSLLLTVTGSLAQNNTYSPYSRFGIGDITKKGFGRHTGLGGIGIGLRDNNHINYMNPAANSAQDTMSFMFSTGITANAMQLASNEGSHNVSNITLSHIALSFPLNRWWKTGFGLVPYSQMGYKILDVDLSQQAEHYYDGSGGINQFFFSNSINLTKNFSAGVNLSYLFGSLTQTRRLVFPLEENLFSVNSRSRAMVTDFHIRYGLQYSARIASEYSFTLGAIYENKTPLRTTQDWLIINELSTSGGPVRDTVQNFTGTETHIELPSSWGIGATFRKDNKFIVGADYSIQQWSETRFLNQQYDSLVNSSSLNVGVQYVPDHTDFRNFLKRIQYRLGFHYSDTYLQLRGHQIRDYGLTLGFGIPYGNTRTTFNFSIDAGRRGTKEMNLIQENYIMFNFSLALYDFWFFKRRYE